VLDGWASGVSAVLLVAEAFSLWRLWRLWWWWLIEFKTINSRSIVPLNIPATVALLIFALISSLV
jgi:hypothetical protein